MPIERKTLQSVVTISLNAAGEVTQAWRVPMVAFVEDGVQVSPAVEGDRENFDPKELIAVLPHAALVEQISAMTDVAKAEALRHGERERALEAELAQARDDVRVSARDVAERDAALVEINARKRADIEAAVATEHKASVPPRGVEASRQKPARQK